MLTFNIDAINSFLTNYISYREEKIQNSFTDALSNAYHVFMGDNKAVGKMANDEISIENITSDAKKAADENDHQREIECFLNLIEKLCELAFKQGQISKGFKSFMAIRSYIILKGETDPQCKSFNDARLEKIAKKNKKIEKLNAEYKSKQVDPIVYQKTFDDLTKKICYLGDYTSLTKLDDATSTRIFKISDFKTDSFKHDYLLTFLKEETDSSNVHQWTTEEFEKVYSNRLSKKLLTMTGYSYIDPNPDESFVFLKDGKETVAYRFNTTQLSEVKHLLKSYQSIFAKKPPTSSSSVIDLGDGRQINFKK